MKLRDDRLGGSTLLLSLWALILLSAVVFVWAARVGAAMDAAAVANRALEARALAHSGMAVAMHPGISRTSPHLKAEVEPGKSYAVTFESEGGRVNLNYLLAGAHPQKIAFLKAVLALHGLTLPEREVLVDCLLDWVNPPTGLRRPNGRAEGPDYRPPHRPLQSLDELAEVEGSGSLTGQPGWRSFFTLESTGPLDLESVSADLLALVPGISESRAQHFVKLREERRMQSQDAEGRPYQSIGEALGDLGLSPEQLTPVSSILGFHDPVRRVTSVGTSGGVTRQVTAIVRTAPGRAGELLLWIENESNNPCLF